MTQMYYGYQGTEYEQAIRMICRLFAQDPRRKAKQEAESWMKDDKFLLFYKTAFRQNSIASTYAVAAKLWEAV